MSMKDLFDELRSTLGHNKLRTSLTGFAVAWGVFMLIALLGAGNGLLNVCKHRRSADQADGYTLATEGDGVADAHLRSHLIDDSAEGRGLEQVYVPVVKSDPGARPEAVVRYAHRTRIDGHGVGHHVHTG